MGCCISDLNNNNINKLIVLTTIVDQNNDICQLTTLDENKILYQTNIITLKSQIDVKKDILIKQLDNILPNDLLEIIKNLSTSRLLIKLIELEKPTMEYIEQMADKINILGLQIIDKSYIEKQIFVPIIDLAKEYLLLEKDIEEIQNMSEIIILNQKIIDFEKKMINFETEMKNIIFPSILKLLLLDFPPEFKKILSQD